MPKLSAILADEGLTKEATKKGVPKGKLHLEGQPYNFRRWGATKWENASLRDFEKLENLVDEGYRMFGEGDVDPDSLADEVQALEAELKKKKEKLAEVKKIADALRKEGIEPDSLVGGFMFYATDEDGQEWEHQPDGWYPMNS
jgi:hypothetical protein